MPTPLAIVVPIPKDSWNATAVYNLLNVVTHDGRGYICKAAGSGIEPTPTGNSQWQLIADRGEPMSFDQLTQAQKDNLAQSANAAAAQAASSASEAATYAASVRSLLEQVSGSADPGAAITAQVAANKAAIDELGPKVDELYGSSIVPLTTDNTTTGYFRLSDGQHWQTPATTCVVYKYQVSEGDIIVISGDAGERRTDNDQVIEHYVWSVSSGNTMGSRLRDGGAVTESPKDFKDTVVIGSGENYLMVCTSGGLSVSKKVEGKNIFDTIKDAESSSKSYTDQRVEELESSMMRKEDGVSKEQLAGLASKSELLEVKENVDAISEKVVSSSSIVPLTTDNTTTGYFRLSDGQYWQTPATTCVVYKYQVSEGDIIVISGDAGERRTDNDQVIEHYVWSVSSGNTMGSRLRDGGAVTESPKDFKDTVVIGSGENYLMVCTSGGLSVSKKVVTPSDFEKIVELYPVISGLVEDTETNKENIEKTMFDISQILSKDKMEVFVGQYNSIYVPTIGRNIFPIPLSTNEDFKSYAKYSLRCQDIEDGEYSIKLSSSTNGTYMGGTIFVNVTFKDGLAVFDMPKIYEEYLYMKIQDGVKPNSTLIVNRVMDSITRIDDLFGSSCAYYNGVRFADNYWNIQANGEKVLYPIQFAMVNDIHESWESLESIDWAFSRFDISGVFCFVLAGDTLGGTLRHDVAIGRCEAYKRCIAKLNKPLLYVFGGHDYCNHFGTGNATDKIGYCLTKQDLKDYLLRPSLNTFAGKENAVYSWDEEGLYYYMDDTAHNTRYICLDESDSPDTLVGTYNGSRIEVEATSIDFDNSTFDTATIKNIPFGDFIYKFSPYKSIAFSQRELVWLANTLKASNGMTINVFNHVGGTNMFNQLEYTSNAISVSLGNSIRIMWDMLAAFANRTQFTANNTDPNNAYYCREHGSDFPINISVDFSGCTGNISAVFYGHAHCCEKSTYKNATYGQNVVNRVMCPQPGVTYGMKFLQKSNSPIETGMDVIMINNEKSQSYNGNIIALRYGGRRNLVEGVLPDVSGHRFLDGSLTY